MKFTHTQKKLNDQCNQQDELDVTKSAAEEVKLLKRYIIS